MKNDRLLLGGVYKEVSIPRDYYIIKNISHIFNNNIYYIAGLITLKSWYKYIRPLFISDYFSENLVKGMQDNLNSCIMERLFRLKEFCRHLPSFQEKGSAEKKDTTAEKMANCDKALITMELAEKVFDSEFKKDEVNDEGGIFIKSVEKRIGIAGKKYIDVIKGLESDEQNQGIIWLFHIEQRMVGKLLI